MLVILLDFVVFILFSSSHVHSSHLQKVLEAKQSLQGCTVAMVLRKLAGDDSTGPKYRIYGAKVIARPPPSNTGITMPSEAELPTPPPPQRKRSRYASFQ